MGTNGGIWDDIRSLAGEDVPLLCQRRCIQVIAVGENAVTVRKSTGRADSIPRALIERVCGEIGRRGAMTRDEIYETIDQRRHSSTISALLVATKRFRYTLNPITLFPLDNVETTGSGTAAS